MTSTGDAMGDEPELRLRPAIRDDLDELAALDAAAFAATGGLTTAPGELNVGIVRREVTVARFGAETVGFVQVTRLDEHGADDRRPQWFISGLAVDPNHQGRGIGRRLLEHASDATPDRAALTAAVAPGNRPMLSLLLNTGFVADGFVAHLYGEDEHRVMVRRADGDYVPAHAELSLAPLRGDVLAEAFGRGCRGIGIVDRGHGVWMRMAPPAANDATLVADEVATGVGFAAALLAVAAFVFTIGVDTDRGFVGRGPEILLLVAVAFIAALVSLVAYATASGAMAHHSKHSAHRHLEVGNALSEYFGVLLLIQVIPLMLAMTTEHELLGWVACIVAAVALVGYQLSELAMWRQLPLPRPILYGFGLFVAAGPLIAHALFPDGEVPVEPGTGMVVWATVNVVLLAAMTALHLWRGDVGSTRRVRRT